MNCRLHFGNYNKNDIIKYELKPFNTSHNADLNNDSVGYLADFTVGQDSEHASQSKFKELLHQTESLLNKYQILNETSN